MDPGKPVSYSLVLLAALDGLIAVVVGAFATHTLEGRMTAEAAGWIDTGSRYQLVHAVAAIAVAFAAGTSRRRLIAGWAMATGAFVFSASLYGLAAGFPRFLGAVAPVGGSAMILGWGLVALDAFDHLPFRKARG